MQSSKATYAFTIMSVLFLALSCKPRYPACKKDGHCREGEFCVNGVCQQCREDGDCDGGMTCMSGVCRPPGYCEELSDCTDGQVCRNNACGPCLATNECPEGKACIDGVCREPECHSDDECPAGLYCKDGQCAPQETVEVTGDAGACDIEPIYFGFDSAEVTSKMRDKLGRIYECLDKADGSVVLEGHCDPRGTTEYNMALGDRRARMVKKLLKVMGMDASKIRAVSKGEEEAKGTNEETWAKERRVEFN